MSLSEDVKKFLKKGGLPEVVEDVTDIQEIVDNSEEFSKLNPFPTDTTRCYYLLKEKKCDPETLLKNVNGTYPLIHQDLIPLFVDFIHFKLKHGSKIEKAIYENITIPLLVDRYN